MIEGLRDRDLKVGCSGWGGGAASPCSFSLLGVHAGLDVAGIRGLVVVRLAFFALFDLQVFALVVRLAVGRTHAAQVDAELLRRAQQVVVLVAGLFLGFADYLAGKVVDLII